MNTAKILTTGTLSGVRSVIRQVQNNNRDFFNIHILAPKLLSDTSYPADKLYQVDINIKLTERQPDQKKPNGFS